ncbi:MAG: LysM peptidoglycan-binding domain-containing protein [Nitrospira sp.]|nr:LysM peptidoglycan-binding domain-containing protein [Nitrospira sp.]
MKVKIFLLCLSGVFFGAGDALASGMPQLLPVASSSQLPAPASSGGPMYFPPDPRPDSITHVPLTPAPLTPALSHQGRGSYTRGGYTYEAIPVIVNSAVERNIHYFQNVIHDRFQEWLTRFYPYRPLIEQIFVEFGLPKELVYLSLVESGFNPRAYSRARASGPWQFIKSTGRIYGLRVNWYVDERRDPIKSTVAAARHLRDLYDLFGSWSLALASYNAGPGKISRAIARTGTRDFWTIARTRYIRRETKQYVPKFMAAMIIATRPSLFGFHADFQPVHEYEEIHVNRSIHLRSVSREAGLSFEELRRLNPELRRNVIPSDQDGYFLKVPVGTSGRVEQVKTRLKTWTQRPPQRTWYRVRRGDNLSVIAHRFGTSVRKLKNLNGLSGNVIRIGQRLRVNRDSMEAGAVTKAGEVTWYRVRRGDSLSVIAHRFGTSVRKLKNLNGLSGNVIRVGQRLRVNRDVAKAGEVTWYRVRMGDSLWSIAKRFRVSVKDLKVLNNLRSSLIRVGRRLMIAS